MIGISIHPRIGLGDSLQFSSLPENYFRATGKKLVDLTRPWFFDHNPFVMRGAVTKLERTVELWNFGPKQYDFPKPRPLGVYLSNAEIHAAVLNVPARLIRPRLYQFEDFRFEDRRMILVHVDGRSHGTLPTHVIDHIVKKYAPTGQLYQIGVGGPDVAKRLLTPTFWDLAKAISMARMFIGIDSGPSWVAACFPDVALKVVRVKPDVDTLRTWVPLEVQNIHAHWDDRCRQTFNVSDEDVGFTYSYRKL